MKRVKRLSSILVITILFFNSQQSNAQSLLEDSNYSVQNGITLSLSSPVAYGIGYDLKLTNSSLLRTTLSFDVNSKNEPSLASFTSLPTGEYKEYLQSSNKYRVSFSTHYLNDIVKYKTSKIYLGFGAGISFGEEKYDFSRELNLSSKSEKSISSDNHIEKTLSFDIFSGYEYQITSPLQLFIELGYRLEIYNIESTKLNGWVIYPDDYYTDNQFLTPSRSYKNSNNGTKHNIYGKIGMKFSF